MKMGRRGKPGPGEPPQAQGIGGITGIAPQSALSEEDRAIMPDFKKWREAFYMIDWICVGSILFLECFIQLYFYITGYTTGGDIAQTAYMFLPSIINVSIMAVVTVLRKRIPETNMQQNVLPILLLFVMDMVLCMTHEVFYAALGLFALPICMTVVFSSKKLCKLVTGLSITGIIIFMIKQLLVVKDAAAAAQVVPQCVISICGMVITCMVILTALGMTEGQRLKLLNYALSIKEAQRRAEAGSLAKSEFLANMSHEIRTPINAILGMNEMIIRENTNAQIAEYAKSVNVAGNSLLYLVNDVLDISKIESGKLEIIETDYDTASFIHDCYTMIAERAQNKKLELNVECSDKIPSKLRGDEIRLRQVVTNLLSNAAKYTNEGRINLSAEGVQKDGKFYFVIEVRDTGMGIKPENLEQLFNKFSRFDMEKNRNVEGTGLGLAITKQLVDLMQGEIKVHSIYGVGSSFTVEIPQVIVDSSPIGDFQKRYRDLNQSAPTSRQTIKAPQARILVVDDVEVNLKVIVNLLKETEIQVDTAKSGADCLELVAKKKYDLLFLDHMMPQMDGIEVFERMKKMDDCPSKDMPVIMLTANAVSGVREQYLKIGFTDYISKPVSGEKIEGMLMKYLPQDKVKLVEVSDGAAQSGSGSAPEETVKKPQTPLEKFSQAYKDADIDYGLSTCGGAKDVYIDILQTFAEESKVNDLDEFYANKDTENFQILVHGIKGASMSMGFQGFSERARSLEIAAKENDWKFIEGNYESFSAEYKEILSAINEALPRT